MSSLSDEDRANLSAYLDGELDEEATQLLEAKISQDPAARAEVESIKQAWAMLEYLPRPTPSATFTHRTMERLSLERPAARQTGKMAVARRSWAKGVLWAAALLMIAAAGYLVGERLAAPDAPDADEPLVQHLRIIERWRAYEMVDDLEFLKSLDHPDLFGDDLGS